MTTLLLDTPSDARRRMRREYSMGELDIAAKALLQEVPEDIARLALGAMPIGSVRAADTTLPAFSLTMDKLLRVELEGEEDPLWLHVEVQANWAADVPRRVFEYWSLAHRAHDHLWSVVVCLKPGSKQGDPRDCYERRTCGLEPLTFRFGVVRAWELEPRDLLSRATPGLLPLIPFAGGVTEDEVQQALEVLGGVEPRKRRAELQAALAAFAGNTFPETRWLAKIPKEILMDSTTYQEIRAEGRAEGELSGQRKLLALQMSERLGEKGAQLAIRLATATETQLTEVGKLLASKRSDEELVQGLDGLLPTGE